MNIRSDIENYAAREPVAYIRSRELNASLLAHRPARALPAAARRRRLCAPRGATRRAAAAEGHRRRGALQGRHGVGRVHRPARSRQHRRGPAARVRLRLRGALSRRRGRQSRRSALPDRRAAVSGRGRSPEGGAGAGAGDRAARDARRRSAPSASQRRTRCRARRAIAARRSPRKPTAQVDAVAAALRAAELNLEFTRVTSPIAGRVGRAIATEGNLVSSGPGEATLLTTVVSLDPDLRRVRRRRAELPALRQPRERGQARQRARSPGCRSRWRWRRPGVPASGQDELPRQPGRSRHRHDSRPRRSSPIPTHDLTPGLFVRLRLPGTAAYDGALVRDAAIGTDLDKRYVLVVDEGPARSSTGR